MTSEDGEEVIEKSSHVAAAVTILTMDQAMTGDKGVVLCTAVVDDDDAFLASILTGMIVTRNRRV